jgi:DNA-binding response OmpR family regulator
MQYMIKEENDSALRSPKLNNRILLVDDEFDITLTFTKILEDEGFKVDSFNDPQKALSNFKAGSYDIAIIDVKMHQMNGFDLYRKLRRTDNNVKYCFMTAYKVYYEVLKKDYPGLDIGWFIKKPISAKELVVEITSKLCS